jgi:hypothetical protein
VLYEKNVLIHTSIYIWSRDSSTSIATGWTAQGGGIRFPVGARNLSLLRNVQTGSGVYAASYPMGTGAPSPGVKLQGCETDHSPPTSAEVKNVGAIPSFPHTSSWLGAYLIKYRNIFTFTFYMYIYICVCHGPLLQFANHEQITVECYKSRMSFEAAHVYLGPLLKHFNQ